MTFFSSDGNRELDALTFPESITEDGYLTSLYAMTHMWIEEYPNHMANNVKRRWLKNEIYCPHGMVVLLYSMYAGRCTAGSVLKMLEFFYHSILAPKTYLTDFIESSSFAQGVGDRIGIVTASCILLHFRAV